MGAWQGFAGLGLVLISAFMLLILNGRHRKKGKVLRDITAFRRLHRAVGLVVEDGSRLHVSLGHGAMHTPQSASALAGLSLLKRLAGITSAGDNPPIASSGDATLAILSRDALQETAERSGNGNYDATLGRLTGLTAFSYAAGAIPVIRDEKVTTNVMMGNFGIEVALLDDAGERENSFVLAGSDNLNAQAVILAGAQEPLIGEEMFAAGAYLEPGSMQTASLSLQDILRWLIIAAILGGSVLMLVGWL